MTRTAVLVSGGGTNLQALIDAKRAGGLPSCELALVVSSREDACALRRAGEAGIAAAAFSRKALGQAAFERQVLAALEEHRIELVVLAGFLTVLSAGFVARYPRRILNVHPSLIPAFSGEGYYGLKVHEAALRRGVRLTGATVHFVNEVPDGGDIILQKAVRVMKGDTPESLQLRVMRQAEWRILPRAVEAVCRDIERQKRKGKSHV